MCGKSRTLSHAETYDRLVGEIAPLKTKFVKEIGENVFVADKEAIYRLPKSERDSLVSKKAKELGLRGF